MCSDSLWPPEPPQPKPCGLLDTRSTVAKPCGLANNLFSAKETVPANYRIQRQTPLRAFNPRGYIQDLSEGIPLRPSTYEMDINSLPDFFEDEQPAPLAHTPPTRLVHRVIRPQAGAGMLSNRNAGAPLQRLPARHEVVFMTLPKPYDFVWFQGNPKEVESENHSRFLGMNSPELDEQVLWAASRRVEV